MDKRLIGKWYKEDMGETLNIFDAIPPRMKMSFSSSGHYNFEPNCVYEKDEFLCYEINDEKYRMIYQVKFIDGELKGHYTQFGNETPVAYKKISDEPEDEAYRFMPTEVFVPQTGESRLELLKQYAEYDKSHNEAYDTEIMVGGDFPEILYKYNLFNYVKDIDVQTDAIVFRLLDFVCDNFKHNGMSGMPTGRSITDIIKYCEDNDGKINCRGLAILLAALLRLYYVKAQHITCLPYEDPFDDCHVVVDCILPSGKRIMLDPTWRLYLTDKNGEYISLRDLRRILINDEPIFANKTADYNGMGFAAEYHRNYMIKNTFRFSRGTLASDGCDDHARQRIELIPKGYPTEKFSIKKQKEFVYDDELFWKF